MAPPIPDKIACTTSSDFAFQLKDISNTLSQPETEDNWEHISRALLKLAALTKGGAHKLDPDYVAAIKTLYKPITTSMLSERTRLSGSAFDLISSFAPRLANRFEPLVPILIPAILKVATRPSKIFVTRAQTCLLLILEHCHLPSIIIFIREAIKDKSQSLRLAAIEGTVKIVQTWDRSILEVREGAPALGLRNRGNVEDVETIIKDTVRDANPQIRQISRKAFEAYTEMFPDRTDSFTGPLTPTTRRYLELKSNNPGSVKSHALQTNSQGSSQVSNRVRVVKPSAGPAAASHQPPSRPQSRAGYQPAINVPVEEPTSAPSYTRPQPAAQPPQRAPTPSQQNEPVRLVGASRPERSNVATGTTSSGAISSLPPSRPQFRPNPMANATGSQPPNPSSSSFGPQRMPLTGPMRPHNVNQQNANPSASNGLAGLPPIAVPMRSARAKTDMGPPTAPTRAPPTADTGSTQPAVGLKDPPFRPLRRVQRDPPAEKKKSPAPVPVPEPRPQTPIGNVVDLGEEEEPILVSTERVEEPRTPIQTASSGSVTPEPTSEPQIESLPPAVVAPPPATTTPPLAPVVALPLAPAVVPPPPPPPSTHNLLTSTSSTKSTASSISAPGSAASRPRPAVLIKKQGSSVLNKVNTGAFVPTRKRTGLSEPTLSQMAKMKPAVANNKKDAAPASNSSSGASSTVPPRPQKKTVEVKKPAVPVQATKKPPVVSKPASKLVASKAKKAPAVGAAKGRLVGKPAPEVLVAMAVPLPPATPDEVPLPPVTPDEVPLPPVMPDEVHLLGDQNGHESESEDMEIDDTPKKSVDAGTSAGELGDSNQPLLVDLFVTPAPNRPSPSSTAAPQNRASGGYANLINFDQSLVWTGEERTPLMSFQQPNPHPHQTPTLSTGHPFSVLTDSAEPTPMKTPRPVQGRVVSSRTKVVAAAKDFMADDSIGMVEIAELERVALGEKEINILVGL